MNYSQQARIFPPERARPVTLIGAGSVGSAVAVLLAKAGVNVLTVWDADTVMSHNIAISPYFRTQDLARLKVEALADIVREQADVELVPVVRMYAGEDGLRGSVVCCVDTMEARRAIWNRVRLDPPVDLLVDTRVAAELVSVFAIDPNDPDDVDYYEAFLYPSSEAARPMCGLHGIGYVSAVAASVAVANLTSWWKNGRKRRNFKMLVAELDVPEE